VWQNAKDSIFKHLQPIRDELLWDDYTSVLVSRLTMLKALLLQYLHKQPVEQLNPGPGDIAYMPEFRQIFEVPTDVDVTEDSFSTLLERLPELCASWRETVTRTLLDTARTALADSPVGSGTNESLLALATTLFSANGDECGCASVFSFDTILRHRCCRETSAWLDMFITQRHDPGLRRLDSCFEAVGSSPLFWPGPDDRDDDVPRFLLGYYQSAARAAKAIVEMCGKDPWSTTRSEMDELDARFVCTRWRCCSQSNGGSGDSIQLYTWLAAVSITHGLGLE
jgi:hypothetical protein